MTAALAPCERHEMTGCADCADLANPRRKPVTAKIHRPEPAPGDCAVRTYAEITGEDYAEAIRTLTRYGYTPKGGTPAGALEAAFAALGFTTREVTRTHQLRELPRLSEAGRYFWIEGEQRRRGHAWSVTEGRANRAVFTGTYRYRAFEVTA